MSEDELSRQWREEGLRYVSALNAYIAKGLAEGWESVERKDCPDDTREPLAEQVIAVVRRANIARQFESLRERFPPAQEPFLSVLEDQGQSLPVAFWLDDGRIVLRVGAPYENGRLYVIDGLSVETMPNDLLTVGRSRNREFYAEARIQGVTIRRGWAGEVTSQLDWPTGLEGIPVEYSAAPAPQPPVVTSIEPFPDGQRALLVSPSGVFVLTRNGSHRLLSTPDRIDTWFEYMQTSHPGEAFVMSLSMEHGTVSPDGSLIAVGDQDSTHLVFDGTTYELVADVGNLSEYPHYAVFSADGSVVAFNSCHFYNGITIGVPLRFLHGLKTAPYKTDDRVNVLEDGARVYAAATRNDEFIIGDAGGYLRAFGQTGESRWMHFIGSTVGAIDVTRDGKHLLVTTYAGFLCLLDLDSGERDPFAIGTSTHRERRRFIFWKDEPQVLIW